MVKCAVLLLFTFALLACSPQKRLQRLLEKHPELAVNDTLRDTIRVVIPGERIDSTVTLTVHDTLFLDTGRLHVRIIRIPTGSPCDTVAIAAQVIAACDTIREKVPYEVIVEKLVPCPPDEGKVASWWRIAALAFGALLLILLLVKKVQRSVRE